MLIVGKVNVKDKVEIITYEKVFILRLHLASYHGNFPMA